MAKKKGQYNQQNFVCTVTDDDDFFGRYFHIPDAAMKSLRLYSEYVNKNPAGAITGLIDLCQKYSSVPQFKSLLSTAYRQCGNVQKSHAVDEWTLSEHSDYLFARLNRASYYLAENHPEKVEELLGKGMELPLLYPERDIFHVTEMMAFYKIACIYFMAIDNMKEARIRFRSMKIIDRNHPDIAFIRQRMTLADLALHPEKICAPQKRGRKKKE